MPRLDPAGLSKSIERGRRGGTYYLHGDEEYLKEEAAAALVEAHLDPATRDFNYDQLRGTSLDPETLASICNTPPMMADWRVVVVRDLQQVATSARLRDVISGLLDKPVPWLALVLVAPPGAKAKFYADLARRAIAIEFKALPPNDVPDWLIQRAKQAGVTLERDAARALAAAAGTALGGLVRELEKLIDYVGDRGNIGTADVAALVGHVPTANRWEWFDLVSERRISQARTKLPVLLDSKESGVGLVIGLGTQFLRLGIAAAGGQRALAEALGGQQWLVRKIMPQARKWTPREIEIALSDLLRADRLLKSGGAERHVMEELLLRLQQPAPAAG